MDLCFGRVLRSVKCIGFKISYPINVCRSCGCNLMMLSLCFWKFLLMFELTIGKIEPRLIHTYWVSYCFRPLRFVRIFPEESYIIRNGSSNTALSFTEVSFVVFPWNNIYQILDSPGGTFGAEATSVFFERDTREILISVAWTWAAEVDVLIVLQ